MYLVELVLSIWAMSFARIQFLSRIKSITSGLNVYTNETFKASRIPRWSHMFDLCVTSDMTIAFVRTYVHVLTPIDSSVALCSSRWEQPWCPVWKPWWFEAWATTRITRGRAKCYASVASKVGKVEHNECSTMTCTSLSFVNEQRGRLTKRLQRGRLKKEIEQGHIISSGRKTYRATLVTIVKKYSRVKQSVYTSTPSQTVDLLTLLALPPLTIAYNAAPLRRILRHMPLRI